MKELPISELNENMIERIGKDWMLITSGEIDSFNTMTASWGGVGFMWQSPIAVAVVRKSRYTHEFIEKSHRFTLSFYGKQFRSQLAVLGAKSGREMDKMHNSGLRPLALPDGGVTFDEAWLTLECEVLYKDDFKAENFLDKSLLKKFYTSEQGGFHTVYFARITHVMKK